MRSRTISGEGSPVCSAARSGTSAPGLALAVFAPRVDFDDESRARGCGAEAVARPDGRPMSAHDVRRLEKYSQSLVDHHLVADLIPPLARAYFAGNVPATMSYAQTAIVLSLGLQFREMEEVAKGLGLPTQQVMALFNKAVRKMHGALRAGRSARWRRRCRRRRFPNSTRTPSDWTRISRTGTRRIPPRTFSFSFPSSKRSATRLGLARASPTRDGSDGYNPGLRSPEVSLAGATVYSGL